MDLASQPSEQPAASDKLSLAMENLCHEVAAISGAIGVVDMERALLRALQRESVASIGRYKVHSDFSKADETVVFVHNPTPDTPHKYIFATTDTHTFIVAVPMEWTEYHRDVLARIRAAAGYPAECPGGGYLGFKANGVMVIGGASTDFGKGDHLRAREAFERALNNSGK